MSSVQITPAALFATPDTPSGYFGLRRPSLQTVRLDRCGVSARASETHLEKLRNPELSYLNTLLLKVSLATAVDEDLATFLSRNQRGIYYRELLA